MRFCWLQAVVLCSAAAGPGQLAVLLPSFGILGSLSVPSAAMTATWTTCARQTMGCANSKPTVRGCQPLGSVQHHTSAGLRSAVAQWHSLHLSRAEPLQLPSPPAPRALSRCRRLLLGASLPASSHLEFPGAAESGTCLHKSALPGEVQSGGLSIKVRRNKLVWERSTAIIPSRGQNCGSTDMAVKS